MPKMDGKEASKRIRQLEKLYSIKNSSIVMISGNSVTNEVNECLDPNGEIRAMAFIRKPIFKEQLGKIVNEIREKCWEERRIKIAIVDNDHFSEIVLNPILENLKINSERYPTIEELISKLQTSSLTKYYSVLVNLDTSKGKIDEIETLTSFWKKNPSKASLLIGSTSNANVEAMERFKKVGLNRVISLPYTRHNIERELLYN